MKVVTGTELKKIEEYAINSIKLPSLTLMERAALKVFEYIQATSEAYKSVLVVAGVGNNGADGVAVARMLHIAGRKVAVKIVGNLGKATDEFKVQYDIYNNVNGSMIYMEPDYDRYDIVVDALFGIGLKREITGEYKDIINNINEYFSDKTVISVDMPSGIDSDTGATMGVSVKADVTVTFSCKKIGLLLPPGNVFAGKVIVEDIGIPECAYENNYSVITFDTKEEIVLPKRDANGNKGTFGKVLIIAGSHNMSGAAYLCAKAAYRMGSGLVRILTCEENREILQKMLPEAVLVTYKENEEIDLTGHIAWSDCVVVGPGIGKENQAYNIMSQAMDTDKKMVIDADGLNIISEHSELEEKLGKNMIITPHIGEMARLCKKEISHVKENLLQTATDFALQHNIVVVLKDAKTVVADRNASLRYINSSGNDGMGTAGSGDVLAGILGSLYAVDNSAFNSAVNAVYLHGMAGDIAAAKLGTAGVMASDIANMVNETLI